MQIFKNVPLFIIIFIVVVRRHMEGLLSHVNPTNNSEKAILAFVGVLILVHTTGHNESQKSKKTNTLVHEIFA